MKKTLNINLAGYPFTIDEDAYNLLKNYLDTIRYAFDTKDDTGELAADIESRIAEILIEKENNHFRIITAEEITQVINRIGKPSDFIEVEESVNEIPEENKSETIDISFENTTPPPYPPRNNNNNTNNNYSRNPFIRRKLFRDPQNSMLGGVCSGLAAYLNIDPTIVRLIAVLLFFLSGTTVAIIYIVLWIVVPSASTPLQRMQMRGEDPTMANIGKTVTENFQNGEGPDSQNQVNNGFINNLFSIFVKCLVILGLVVAIPLLIVLGATLIGCMIAVFVIGIGIFTGGMFDSVTEGLMVLFVLLAVVGGAITLGVPLWLLIRKIWKKREEPISVSTQRSILIIWLIGIAMLAVFTVKSVKTGMKLDREHWGFNMENIKQLDELDESQLEDLSVENGRVSVTTKDGRKIEIFNGKVSIQEKENLTDSIATDSISTESLTIDENLLNDSISLSE